MTKRPDHASRKMPKIAAACRKEDRDMPTTDYDTDYDYEWKHMRRDFKENVNAGRMIVSDLREEVSDLREEVADLRIENERLRFPLTVVEYPYLATDEDGVKEAKPENPTRKTYEKLDIGDILIHESGQTKYMVIATPTSKKQGRHLLFQGQWSALCVENSDHKRRGIIYQASNSDFLDVELVDYDIIETGAIKKVKEVSAGEAFIHADNGVVYMICEVNSTVLAVTFDGRAALVASELNIDDSVSMVKLEMTRRGENAL